MASARAPLRERLAGLLAVLEAGLVERRQLAPGAADDANSLGATPTMKIVDIRLTGLKGGTVEGGWAEELAPEDNVHTVVEVLTSDGRVGLGSTFTSSHLVSAAVRYAALAKDKPLAALAKPAQFTRERGAAREALRKAFEDAGIVFTNHGEPGLKHRRSSTEGLDSD